MSEAYAVLAVAAAIESAPAEDLGSPIYTPNAVRLAKRAIDAYEQAKLDIDSDSVTADHVRQMRESDRKMQAVHQRLLNNDSDSTKP